jgi:hypothetical protein
MKNNIPTAEEFIRKEYDKSGDSLESINCEGHHVQFMLVEFAKLHVEAALKEASNKALLKDEGRYVLGDEDWHEDLVVDKKSILNAYPLTNVK